MRAGTPALSGLFAPRRPRRRKQLANLGHNRRVLHIGVLSLHFRLPGCASLKEKRRRLARLRDKFGRSSNLAVCESGHQDSHSSARWEVVAVAGDAGVVERSLAEVERWVAESLDAILVDIAREFVPMAAPGGGR